MPKRSRRHESVKSVMPDDGDELQCMFDQLNQKLFDGKLPSRRVRFSHRVKGIWRGEYDSKRRLILLRPDLQGEDLRHTLIHEMCHVNTRDKAHGERWQTKMLALAEKGEAWVVEHLELYRERPTWNQKMAQLREQIEYILAGESELGQTHTTFRQMLRMVSPSFGLSPLKFYKKVPWLKAAYKKACREVDKYYEEQKRIAELVE